ncbi:MAG: 4-vinyl reductase [Myxococcota bacterium]
MNAPKDGCTLDLNFDLEALLERDSHLLFHPQMLRNLRGELERELGRERAWVAALQMGCLLGMRDGLAAAETLLPTHSAEKPVQQPALPMRFGCASRVNSALALHGQWPSTSEARAYAECSREACLISMGYTSGWLSEATGTQVLALETGCRGEGDSHCQFTALEPSGWQILNDPQVPRLLDALPMAALRALVGEPAAPGAERQAYSHENEAGAVTSTEIQLWPPLMVIHSAQPAAALRALELLDHDPAARGISVVILHFDGALAPSDCSPDAFQPFLAAVAERGADAIYAAIPPDWAKPPTALPRSPWTETESLETAIALGLQVARAQNWNA